MLGRKLFSTIDNAEIGRFSRLSQKWGHKYGEFRMLYKMNELRVNYVRSWSRNLITPEDSLKGLKILDVGCGGGYFALALARWGASVTAIDACKENVEAAESLNANLIRAEGLDIQFKFAKIEELPHSKYNIVVASEVLEHVGDQAMFLRACLNFVTDTGFMFLSSIAKNPWSRLLVIDVAEKFLNLVPKGTHDYHKLISPAEIQNIFGTRGRLMDIRKTIYNPILGRWQFDDSSFLPMINYFAIAIKGNSQAK